MHNSGHLKWMETHHQVAVLQKYGSDLPHFLAAQLHVLSDFARKKEYIGEMFPSDSESVRYSVSKVRRVENYKESNHFQPFFRMGSYNGNRRLETFFMETPSVPLVYIKIRDYDSDKEVGLVITRKKLLSFASGMIRGIVGETRLPIERGKMAKLLEFYFKARRKDRGSERYIYRAAINDCLKEGQVYAAQLQKRYGISAMRGHKILQEMREAGILQSRKYGGMVVYTFAVEVHEVRSVVNVESGLLGLRK